MSFWEHLKPSKRDPVATAVQLAPDGAMVALTWDDGLTSQLSARALRQACPCAQCVEEWSGQRTFAPDSIPTDMTVLGVQQVGNYALTFTFGDQHSTGIFTWGTLRDLAAGASPPAP